MRLVLAYLFCYVEEMELRLTSNLFRSERFISHFLMDFSRAFLVSTKVLKSTFYAVSLSREYSLWINTFFNLEISKWFLSSQTTDWPTEEENLLTDALLHMSSRSHVRSSTAPLFVYLLLVPLPSKHA